MSNIGCVINTKFERASVEDVNLFKGMAVANIGDCMNRTAAIHSSIRPYNNAPLLGTAFTVKVAQGDNLMFHKAMDLAQPGDVIVIDAGGFVDRAIFGELMLNYCKVRGITVNMGLNPTAVAVAICVAASAPFLTPVGSGTNTLIVKPGNLGFKDFFVPGLGVTVLTIIVALIFIPLIWLL